MKVGRTPARHTPARTSARRTPADGTVATKAAPRRRRSVDGPTTGRRARPQTAPQARPVDGPGRPTSASQAKARAKARKAKAPRVVRQPLRERLLARLAGVDLRPRTLLARIPFVVLVIGSLAVGLGITLWLSTDAAQRSYQLSSARALNDALVQQKESLERDVLQAQSAPALADAARNLGMIPSRGTAHLVQDPAGNWVVVGQPRPAEGAPPPPLNTKLPEEKPAPPPAPAPPAAPAPKPGAQGEVPVVVAPPPNPYSAHAAGAPAVPGPALPPGAGPTQGGLVLVPVAPPGPGAAPDSSVLAGVAQ